MSIQDATFAVQRGDTPLVLHFSCVGSELNGLLKCGDMLVVQVGADHKSFVPFVKGKQIWSTWGYARPNREIQSPHPGKTDSSWVAFKDNHDKGPGSTADFSAISELKVGDIVAVNNDDTVRYIEDTYVDKSGSTDRFSIKVSGYSFYDQNTTKIYLVDKSFDILPDDALLAVTDGDNGHKSVTGAQVKDLFAGF